MSKDYLISLFALVGKKTQPLHILEKDDQMQIDFESFTKLNKYITNSFFKLHAKYTKINNERLNLLSKI